MEGKLQITEKACVRAFPIGLDGKGIDPCGDLRDKGIDGRMVKGAVGNGNDLMGIFSKQAHGGCKRSASDGQFCARTPLSDMAPVELWMEMRGVARKKREKLLPDGGIGKLPMDLASRACGKVGTVEQCGKFGHNPDHNFVHELSIV